MAEHLTRNEKVVGSIPTISSIYTGQKRCHEQKHREIGAFVVFLRKYQPFSPLKIRYSEIGILFQAFTTKQISSRNLELFFDPNPSPANITFQSPV